MKEYVAETGGRYTYADDVLSLQDLALSMTALLEGCSDMILSGCEVTGAAIAPGYLWLGGKVRRYEGCAAASFPYYIYEHNVTESVTYAKQVNKRGRISYMAVGGTSVPDTKDAVTDALPRFIEVTAEYAPRLRDKFFGKYAVLLEPLRGQAVQKDLAVAGKFSADKEVESKVALVVSGTNGYSLRQKITAAGAASLGLYRESALLCEIALRPDGILSLTKNGNLLATLSSEGLVCQNAALTSVSVGTLRIFGGQLFNVGDNNDQGAVKINYEGYEQGVTRYRNFEVYDGRRCMVPLLKVDGATRTATVDGTLCVSNVTQGIVLKHPYLKGNAHLTGTISWEDSNNEKIAEVGFASGDTFDFSIASLIGSLVLQPKEYVDVQGTLRVNGTDIAATYITQTACTEALGLKVDKVDGKGLSAEDFSSGHKKKLDAISTSAIASGGEGYVTAKDAKAVLEGKLGCGNNLSDVTDAAAARVNLDVYSRQEAGKLFLTIGGGLQELVSLTAEEVNGLTVEEAAALKASKQAAVRNTIDAEQKGTGEKKLAKERNLADLPDIVQARRNISVYSSSEVDKLLAGKLGTDGAYGGEIFTPELKAKLDAIKSGNFNYTDAEGTSHAQTEGYVTTSQVIRELTGKAPLLMDGYDIAQRQSIATNLGIYTQDQSDARFASLESLFQDYVTYLVKQGKTTAQAQQILREKFDVFSKKEITDAYLRKDGRLGDLLLPNTDAKKQACNALGAAFATEYQTRLIDTGWLQMQNSGNSTDASRLFVRQIGDIVSIQGQINTAKRDGGNNGGTLAIIPNQVQPPRYGLRKSMADFNDDHKFNRGASFFIDGGSRKLTLNESGWYNVWTNIHFTYFT